MDAPRRGRRGGEALTVHEDADGRRRIVVDGRTFLVYQVYYDERSARRVDPWYTPYHSARVGPFFESAIIVQLLAARAHRAADYFGVFSWKFAAKIPLDARAIAARVQRDRCVADVYSFFGQVTGRRLWPMADQKHPGILRAATALLRRLDIDVDLERLDTPIIYQNHFVCQSPLYERFGRELLEPALAAMADRADEELQSLLLQDAGYEDPSVSSAQLAEIFGRPHFCLHPFIAERLFSTWLGLNPAVRVRHVWRGRFVERDNVPYEPEMRRSGSR
jgi:hypothetical protein